MDFVTDTPESKALGDPVIFVIVDQLTPLVTYLLCWKDIDSPELAWRFFEHVSCMCGIVDDIVTYRGSQCRSQFWTW